ncbi:MAG: calcium-binding protein [Sandaracinus sp.]|nr:calcium-binding protein [Sandaracinus sp.]
MTRILDLLAGALGDGQLDSIAGQIGARPDQVRSALGAGLAALLGGLQQQVGRPGGAQALERAVERDHDGSLLDGLGGLLGGAGPNTGVGGLLEMAGSMLGAAPGPGSARSTDGAGILGHILGSRRGAVEQGMAQAGGLDLGQASKLLMLIAPLVMAALGKARSGGGTGGLGDLIGREADSMGRAGGGGGGLLGSLLDQDDDGSIADDLAKLAGKNILGGLFR